jgi:hypothetical protein
LVGADCKILIKPYYENETEELRQSLKKYICVKLAAHQEAK